MTTEDEVFKTGIQCLKAILAVFFISWVLVQYHEPMWEGICASMAILAGRIRDGLLLLFPALPSACALLMAFMLWLNCLNFKLSSMNRLTKALWKKCNFWFCGAWASTAILYISWMSISNSGTTALKVFSTIGMVICSVGGLFMQASYADQDKKPDQ